MASQERRGARVLAEWRAVLVRCLQCRILIPLVVTTGLAVAAFSCGTTRTEADDAAPIRDAAAPLAAPSPEKRPTPSPAAVPSAEIPSTPSPVAVPSLTPVPTPTGVPSGYVPGDRTLAEYVAIICDDQDEERVALLIETIVTRVFEDLDSGLVSADGFASFMAGMLDQVQLKCPRYTLPFEQMIRSVAADFDALPPEPFSRENTARLVVGICGMTDDDLAGRVSSALLNQALDETLEGHHTIEELLDSLGDLDSGVQVACPEYYDAFWEAVLLLQERLEAE